MSERQETIADIIAEMRGQAGNDGYPLDIKHYSDRLEAAHKRERGDCAKLREVVKHIKDRLPHMLQYMRVHWEDASAGGYFDELMLAIDAALAAPPRNCDRFANAVEAMAELKRVHSYCAKENRRCLEDCPDCGKEWCSLAWLFALATESEAQA